MELVLNNVWWQASDYFELQLPFSHLNQTFLVREEKDHRLLFPSFSTHVPEIDTYSKLELHGKLNIDP